jgi:hypothetical protein
MLWPTVTLVGWFAMAALVIALGRGSTIRYEAERARARQPAVAPSAAPAPVPAGLGGPARAAQPAAAAVSPDEGSGAARRTAVATATHPAGKRLPDGAPPAWWLVEDSEEAEWLGRAVAGPFADRSDAEWALLSGEHPASTRPVYAISRGDGAVLRRQAPEDRAWFAELGAQLERLPEEWDGLLTEDDALTTLVVEIGSALVEAGLPLHDGSGFAPDDVAPAGGVCLTPDPCSAGVLVAWRQHDRMDLLHVRGVAAGTAVRRTTNPAVADVLSELGFSVEPIGPWGCYRVTSVTRG